MFFTAKETVERKARERGRWEGRREGIETGRLEGIEAERERIARILEAHGAYLSPELAQRLAGDEEQPQP